MSEISRLRRPKPGETEEDLLKEMETFHLQPNRGPSIIKNMANKESNDGKNVTTERNLKRHHEDKETSHQKPINQILQSIVVEKDISFYEHGSSSPMSGQEYFPDVLKLDKALLNRKPVEQSSSSKKISIFAQQVKAKGFDQASSHLKTDVSSTRSSARMDRNFGEDSLVLQNSKILSAEERKSIHEGNINILNAKTEDQILKDKESLLKTLDPSIVSFLMNKKNSTSAQEILNSSTVASKKATEKEVSPMEVGEMVLSNIDGDCDEKKMIDSGDLNELKKFVHMQTVEPEKLEWMIDIKNETGVGQPVQFNARFDFSGNLLPFDNENISIRAGLHHHGEEPNRPGYSVEELMTLCRSKFPQQRAIAFTTLAHVIENFKKGKFDACFSSDKILLEELIKADLVFLLRTGLDDNTSVSNLDSVVYCLAELVDNEIEEIALDSQFFASVSNGFVQPSLQVKISSEEAFQKETPELKDVQILRTDLIFGLLRMDILDRISYILSNIRPASQTTILNIIRILIRVARHSLVSSMKIVQHKTLLSVIVESFLPLTSALSSSTKQLYDTPVHSALKLIRVLMSWSKTITMDILAKYDVGKIVLCYISIEPSQLSTVPVQEVLRLIIEACRVWIVCLRYGLETRRFLEFFPIIMSHLKYLNSNVSMNQVDPGTKFNYHHATAIFEVISAALCCTSNKQEAYANVDGRAVREHLLDWSNFTTKMGILDVVELSLKKWVAQIHSSQNEVQHFCYNLLDSGFSLYATFVEKYSNSDNYEPMTLLTKLEEFVPFVCEHLLKNKIFSGILREVDKHSVLSRDEIVEGRRRDPDNLPSLGSVSLSGDVLFTLKESSPFKTLNSILTFIKASKRVHSNISLPGVADFLSCDDLKVYLMKIVKVGYKQSSSNWFIRPEITFLRLLIELNHQMGVADTKLMWQVGCVLIASYQVGDEYFIQGLLRDVIFNPKYIDPTDSISWKLKNEKLSGSLPVMSLEDAMPQMLQIYSRLLLPNENDVLKSRFLYQQFCFSTHTITINSNGETCLPNDWPYLPLLTVLSERTKPGSSDQTKPEDVRYVQLCLVWVYLMNSLCKINQHLSNSSVTFRITRLATVFLAGSDLFFDPLIHHLLELSVSDLLAESGCPKFNDPIPGLDSFREFYSQLVEQFQAVSYGNDLFALFILLPCTRFNDEKYRTILWNDQPEALRVIVLKPENLPIGMKLDVFIDEDNRSSINLYRAYLKSLLSNFIDAKRNPLLYEIATRNICAGCQKNVTFKQETLNQIRKVNRGDLIDKLQDVLLC